MKRGGKKVVSGSFKKRLSGVKIANIKNRAAVLMGKGKKRKK